MNLLPKRTSLSSFSRYLAKTGKKKALFFERFFALSSEYNLCTHKNYSISIRLYNPISQFIFEKISALLRSE